MSTNGHYSNDRGVMTTMTSMRYKNGDENREREREMSCRYMCSLMNFNLEQINSSTLNTMPVTNATIMFTNSDKPNCIVLTINNINQGEYCTVVNKFY